MPVDNKILNQQEDKKENGDEYAFKDAHEMNPDNNVEPDATDRPTVNGSPATSGKENLPTSDKLLGDDLEIKKAGSTSEPEDDTIRNKK